MGEILEQQSLHIQHELQVSNEEFRIHNAERIKSALVLSNQPAMSPLKSETVSADPIRENATDG